MFGHDPDEDPEAAVDRLVEELAPDDARSPSTLLARQAALEDVSPAVREADRYPELLAAAATVLRAEVRSHGSDAASLFGMRTASLTIRERCVSELQWFDLDRRLDAADQPPADSPPAADHPPSDDDLLAALADVVRIGDVLPPAAETDRVDILSPDTRGLPNAVVAVLDELLFAAPDALARRHADALEQTRRTVLDRIHTAGPSTVTREAARVAAVLTTHPELEAAPEGRLDSVEASLRTSPDPIIRAWGCYVDALRPDRPRAGDAAQPAALADAVETAFAATDGYGNGPAHAGAWILGRAAATTDHPDHRAHWVTSLSTQNVDTTTDVHEPVLETLVRLAKVDALAADDAPALFESARAGLTTTHEGARRPATALVDELERADVVPADFVDRLTATLAEDATAGDPGVARAALGGLRRLFETTFDSWDLEHPNVAAALSLPARRRLLDASETVLLAGDDATATDAARALRDVAHAAPDGDAAVRATYDSLLDSALHESDADCERAIRAIEQSIPWRLLDAAQAHRFLTEQPLERLATHPPAVRTATAILSSYDAPDAFDLDAYTTTLIDEVPDVDLDVLETVVSALQTVATARAFERPADGIAILAAVADATARHYRAGTVTAQLTRDIEDTVAAVPTPGTTEALSQLLARLRSDDPHRRHAMVNVLDWATPSVQGMAQRTVNPDDPLLEADLATPFVDPLVEHVAQGGADATHRGGAVSVLARYVDHGWLDDDQLASVADLALALAGVDPAAATTLLERPAVVDRLAPADAQLVFETYVSALEPPDRDPSHTLVADAVEDPYPTGALDVVSTFVETGAATPAAFLDALPVRELGSDDAPGISTYLTTGGPPAGSILSLLEWTAARTNRELSSFARPLDTALATGDLGEETTLIALRMRARLDTTARLDGD